MKTPEEIKKGLRVCNSTNISCSECPYDNECPYGKGGSPGEDALAYIQQLESTTNQVSKALCGKENATLEEILQEVSQVKSRLAKAEMEKDALIRFIQKESFPAVISPIPEECQWCKHLGDFTKEICKFCGTYEVYGNFEWRGVCPENTKEDSDA